MNIESLNIILGAAAGVILSVVSHRVLKIFNNSDHVPTLTVQFEAMKSQLAEIKVIVQSTHKLSEEIAVMKRDQETMWDRIDELKRNQTELHSELYQRGKS